MRECGRSKGATEDARRLAMQGLSPVAALTHGEAQNNCIVSQAPRDSAEVGPSVSGQVRLAVEGGGDDAVSRAKIAWAEALGLGRTLGYQEAVAAQPSNSGKPDRLAVPE